MKTIIVPVDFSKCSIEALKFASLTAQKSNAKIHLLHIIQMQNYYFMGTDPLSVPPVNVNDKYYDNLNKEVTKTLEKLQKASYLENVFAVSKIETTHNIYEGILSYARKAGADIIIMGTYGSNSLKEILIGSNAERVVRFSDIPVLVVPKKIDKLKKIVFASDFSKESYLVFPEVRKFAELFGAEICLLKVNTHHQFTRIRDNMDLLRAFNKKFKSDYKIAIYDDYKKEEGIINYADEVDADLIAIGTHGKKGPARFFKEDISGSMVGLTYKPVLAVNFSRRK